MKTVNGSSDYSEEPFLCLEGGDGMRFLAAGDLHYDDIPDGERRLELLTEEIGRQKPDFVVFLGDLCSPKEENRHLMDRLRGTGVPIHFVLGNHDLREGREQALRFFGKEKGYEEFLCGSIRCILLDTNRSPEENGEQMEWLRLIKDHIAVSLSIEPEDLDLSPFDRKGGLGRFYDVFGDSYEAILQEMNVELVA